VSVRLGQEVQTLPRPAYLELNRQEREEKARGVRREAEIPLPPLVFSPHA